MKFHWSFGGMLILILGLFSILTPSLQSPDEGDHVKRAYLLTRGVIVLDSPSGLQSGGNIDQGLLNFMSYPFAVNANEDQKISREKLSQHRDIRWAHQTNYSPAPGTGYYFPALYLPASLGLGVGEILNLRVDASYRLARLFNQIAIVGILLLAFSLSRPSLPMITILTLPSTLFLFVSLNLDAITIAVAVLAFCLYLKILNDISYEKNINKTEFSNKTTYYFFSVCGLLTVTKLNLFPLFFLCLHVTFLLKRPSCNRFLFLTFVLTIFWIGLAASTTVDKRIPLGLPAIQIAIYYALNPFQFFSVLWTTISDPGYLQFFAHGFIGAYLPLGLSQYNNLLILLILVFCFNLFHLKKPMNFKNISIIFMVSIISILLVFYLILSTWNTHPANSIEGVQGRYFLIPLLLISSMFSGFHHQSFSNSSKFGILKKIEYFSNFILFIIPVYSLYIFAHGALTRYYIHP